MLVDKFELMSLEDNEQQAKENSNDGHQPDHQQIPLVCSETDSLTPRLLRNDVKSFLKENIGDMSRFWISLLERTSLPRGSLYTDPRILAAFKTVDSFIDSQPLHLSRLAYVQLSHLYSSLKRIISNNRQDYRINPTDCRKDATIAVDLYASIRTQENRHQTHLRLRRSRRFQDLGGTLPLLLALHSDAAEWMMYVFRDHTLVH